MSTRASASDAAYEALDADAQAVRRAVSDGDGALAAELLDKLRRRAAEAAETLGTYDARRIGETIDGLGPDVARLRRRPKFAFRARAAPPKVAAAQPSAAKHAVESAADSLVHGREGVRLLVTGTHHAVRMHKLSKCVVVVRDAVVGSVLLRDCTHCVFVLTGRQIRIHDCDTCLLLIDATTAPVIERCKGLVFGPRARVPGNVAEGAEVVALDNDSVDVGELVVSGDAWREVKDFNWLRASPSPNWRVLGEDEVVEMKKFTA